MNIEQRNKVKITALKWYCNIVVTGLPLVWVDKAFNIMITEKQDLPTERIKELIDLVIDETLKESKRQ